MPDGSVGVTHEPQSKRIWGFDWRSELPWSLDGVTAEAGTFEQALDFALQHYATIFHKNSDGPRFLDDPLTNAKRRFGSEMDIVLFRDEGRVIGTWMGHPVDWSTYYIRSVALLPEYRDRRIATDFAKLAYARFAAAGVERIECECSPANIPMMKAMSSLGWLVVGTTNSERWGATVRFAKFLRSEAEQVFTRQFCAMAVGGVTQHAPSGAPPTGESS